MYFIINHLKKAKTAGQTLFKSISLQFPYSNCLIGYIHK